MLIMALIARQDCVGSQRHDFMELFLPMPELLTRASYRKDLKRFSAELSLMSPRDDPIGQGTELNTSQGPD